MWVYILILIWLIFITILYSITLVKKDPKKEQQTKYKYTVVASLPIFFIMAFRAHNIGNDTSEYILQFNEIKKYSIKDILFNEFVLFGRLRTEKGYYLFNKIIGLISEEEIFFMISVSFVMLVCVVRFLVINAENPILGLYLYVTMGLYSFMLTGIRQSLAMCVCLLALEAAKKRNVIKFLLWIFVAFSFHKSSIIFVIVYFFANQRLTLFKSILISIATFFSMAYLEPIQEFFNDVLDYDYSIEETGNGQVFLFIIICLLILNLWKYKENISRNTNTIVLYNMQIICTILWILRLFTRTVERPSYYFMFAVIALVPNTINRFYKKNNRRIIVAMIIILFGLLFVYRTVGSPMMVPYSFIWET